MHSFRKLIKYFKLLSNISIFQYIFKPRNIISIIFFYICTTYFDRLKFAYIIVSNFCSLEINSIETGQCETNGITSTWVFCNIDKKKIKNRKMFDFLSCTHVERISSEFQSREILNERYMWYKKLVSESTNLEIFFFLY